MIYTKNMVRTICSQTFLYSILIYNRQLVLGPVVRTSTTQVDICDVNVAREIHKTNTRFMKSEFYENLIAKGFQNMFNTTDPKFHSNRRRLLATPISDSSLHKMEPLISDRVHLAVDKMAQEMKTQGVMDVFKWCLFMATDVIGELSFGESFRMLESGKVASPKSNHLQTTPS